MSYWQFRAAWSRVCGKEKAASTTINDTIVNQISDTSSRAYIECSFTNFDKKKKSRSKEKSINKVNLISQNNNNTLKTINETLKGSSNSSLVLSSKNNQSFVTPTVINSEIKFPSEQRPFIFARDINRMENNYELRMFSSEANIYGKAINKIIRANSYKSNLY